MIEDIFSSPKKNKRYRVILRDGSHYDFGLLGGHTYLDHRDKIKRLNYWKRHLGNKREKHLITNLIPSPSLFSAYLLWGEYTDLDKNIQTLNKMMLHD